MQISGLEGSEFGGFVGLCLRFVVLRLEILRFCGFCGFGFYGAGSRSLLSPVKMPKTRNIRLSNVFEKQSLTCSTSPYNAGYDQGSGIRVSEHDALDCIILGGTRLTS